MNKEEIEELKPEEIEKYINELLDMYWKMKPTKYELTDNDVEIIEESLNLIDKLQKENEKLKQAIKDTAKIQLIATTNYWRDKIRNKIKEKENKLKKLIKKNKKDMFDFDPFIPVYMTEIDILKELLD